MNRRCCSHALKGQHHLVQTAFEFSSAPGSIPVPQTAEVLKKGKSEKNQPEKMENIAIPSQGGHFKCELCVKRIKGARLPNHGMVSVSWCFAIFFFRVQGV